MPLQNLIKFFILLRLCVRFQIGEVHPKFTLYTWHLQAK